MNEIIKYIDEQIKELKSPDPLETELFELCNGLDFNNSYDIKKIKPEKMLEIFTYAFGKEKNIQKIENECINILKNIDIQEEVYVIAKLLELLSDSSSKEIDDLKNFYIKVKGIKSKIKPTELTKFVDKLSKKSTYLIMQFIKYSYFDEIKLMENFNIIELYEKIDKRILDCWVCFLFLYNGAIDAPKESLFNGNDDYIKETKYLTELYSGLYRENKNARRNYNKLLTSYNSLKEKILNTEEGKYISLPNEYYNKLSTEFLLELNYKINAYNTKICEKLTKNNEKIEGFEINNILLKYGINNRFTKDEIEFILSNCNIDGLEENIMTISKMLVEIKYNNQVLLNILTYSSKEKIENIKKGLLLNLINIDFIRNNPTIFLSSANEILSANIELLKNNACRGDNFNELLLNSELEKYFELAKSYGLNIQDSNVIKNITKPYFFDSIDVFIEQDVYEVLLNNTILFNYDLVKILKRIKIANKMKINIFDKTGSLLKSIIDGTNFCVPDELLDQCMFNIVPLVISKENLSVLNSDKRLEYNKEEKLDEQFKKNELTYTFNGINISRLKVLRNRLVLNNESDLTDCLIYGSILNQQEYNAIYEEVNAKKLKKEI